MIIAATAVGMDAARTYREVEQRTSNLSLASGTSTPALAEDFSVRLSNSLSSTSRIQSTNQSLVSRGSGECPPLHETNGGSDTGGKEILSQLTEQVIGQPVTIREYVEDGDPASPTASPSAISKGLVPVQRMELVSSIIYTQEEKVMFSAQGQVHTADGRDITFNLGLSMERRTMIANSVATGLTTFIDPLILRFSADTALLGEGVFNFDLNSDGEKEQLACPSQGCGFLALDRNSDGVIGNGLELFGPASGEGFAELANFDTDANQWIDENDPIFDKLLIYRPDGQGGENLQSLRQAGVGAISIAHAGTKFQLEDQDGGILGSVKASGIFLTEAGEVRSLQEVDLASPATTAVTLPSADNQQELALQALRDIITMQQFRLKMRLAEQRLRGATRKAEQRQWLLEWLQNRNQWQVSMSDDKAGDEGAQATAAQQFRPFANTSG
ncbi:MAG: hypothetical protein OEL83_10730 [Desulforhopalus sp.]|nr:hypothetical protein [Desulforhopalus sp.]